MPKYRPLSERFWEKVDIAADDECWLWTGAKGPGGRYGHIGKERGRGNKRAHRVAWELTHGPIPDGNHVLHTCDNVRCVNPNHLYLGTNDDNVRDRMDRDRNARLKGESNPRALLTEEQVDAIRASYAAGGVSQQKLADQYGVHQTTISHAITLRSWQGEKPC